jgi:aminopeptidase-like protein
LALLQDAIPSIDAVPLYIGAEALGTVEATPADHGLLLMADGHQSVREIAEKVKLSPLEVARILARFRLAGALEVVSPKPVKPAMAATG